jgi:hypothetical protein
MTDPTYPYVNGSDPDERWQAQVVRTARALAYPATPDIAAAVLPRTALASAARGRARPARRPWAWPRWAWAAAVLIALLAGLLAIPRVRAALLDFLQIGVVRVQIEPTATATLEAVAPTGPASGAATPRPPAATPIPTRTPLASVLDLAGATTLEDARARFPHPLRLPAYPPDLGPPDHVFFQDLDGDAVVLVWLDPADPQRVRLSLDYLAAPFMATKGIDTASTTVENTTVNGQAALWLEGQYVLQGRNGQYELTRLVKGHVLIWAEGEVTYRLESDLRLDEAVKVAESLK